MEKWNCFIYPDSKFITPSQKNAQVAEVIEVFEAEEKNNTVVSIANLGDPQDYSITMVYDIQPL